MKNDGLMRTSHSSNAGPSDLHMLDSGFGVETEPLLIDQRLYEVWFAGARIPLTATEFDLLNLLYKEHDRVLSRAEILEAVWGDNGQGLRVVDTYVSRLRTKLKSAGHPGVLSVRKRGYRLMRVVGQNDD